MPIKDRIVVISGEFDPVSSKDVEFIEKCRQKGQWLIVGLHSDWFMLYARGGVVQKYEERYKILSKIKYVDEIFSFNDQDGTVCNLLRMVKICYPNSDITYISEDDMLNMPESKIRGITFHKMQQE
jgi:glycerol-3-phosphate cytidylyltransferase-like family protein